jgi:hypothetical protein
MKIVSVTLLLCGEHVGAKSFRQLDIFQHTRISSTQHNRHQSSWVSILNQSMLDVVS